MCKMWGMGECVKCGGDVRELGRGMEVRFMGLVERSVRFRLESLWLCVD